MKAKDKLKPPAASKVTSTKSGTYVGRRMTTDSKLAFFWQFNGEDKLAGYVKQLTPAQIGECFRFSLDDKSIYTAGEHRPVLLDNAPFAPVSTQIDEWIAADESAYQRQLERKAERAMKNRESEFELALAPIRRLLDAVQSHNDRGALIARITSELWRRG